MIDLAITIVALVGAFALFAFGVYLLFWIRSVIVA